VPAASHPFLRRLGNRIRQLRHERGLSQEAFADDVGLDRSYMSGIERGVRNVSILNLAKIAKALGVPLTALFHNE
jgi:transcriptional regulator with XRE-family HTH domain